MHAKLTKLKRRNLCVLLLSYPILMILGFVDVLFFRYKIPTLHAFYLIINYTIFILFCMAIVQRFLYFRNTDQAPAQATYNGVQKEPYVSPFIWECRLHPSIVSIEDKHYILSQPTKAHPGRKVQVLLYGPFAIITKKAS